MLLSIKIPGLDVLSALQAAISLSILLLNEVHVHRALPLA
jgi:hypothetical protein